MTGWRRTFIGAMVGALISLFVHPVSRPYLVGAVHGPTALELQRFKLGSDKPIQPKSLVEAAHWVQFATMRMVSRTGFTSKERNSLKLVIDEGARRDPTNAFWAQMSALFFHMVGNESAAQRSWIAGANKDAWNDYQSDYLQAELLRLADTTHEQQSWQLAYLYRQRSQAMARLVESLARHMVSQADFASVDSLTLRYATVMNGVLLRKGSRNVSIGQVGATIVELGAYPRDLFARRSPKRLLLGENDLFNNLIAIGKTDWAHQVQDEFKNNEAWQAFASSPNAEDEARDLGMLASVLAVLPGATVAVGVAGAIILLLGELCGRAFKGKGFGWYFPVLAALALGVAVYALTSYIVASIACSLCGVFLVVTPVQQRKVRRTDFGPTFSLTMALLAIASGLCLCVFVVGASGPASVILPALAVPPEYFGGSPLFIGLFVLFVSMIFLVTPFWGIVQRLPTPFVFAEGMKRVGGMLAVSCFTLAVIGGPFVIYADQRAGVTLRRLMLNEPIVYLPPNAHGP